MNHLAEKGFKAWLDTKSLGVTVFTGLTGEKIPEATQCVVANTADSENVVGPLNYLEMQLLVVTPTHSDTSNDEAAALVTHKAMAGVVRGHVADHVAGGLKTAFETEAPSLTFNGGRITGERTHPENGRWVSVIEFRCGVTTS